MKNPFRFISLKEKIIPHHPTILNFGETGNVLPYLKEGWRQPEANRQWSIAPHGRLLIPHCTLNSKEKTYLVTKLTAFVVREKHEQQDVLLTVNGRTIADFSISSSDFIFKIFDISDYINSKDSLEIIFETPNARSPLSLGVSPDPDKLGVCLLSMAIVQEQFWSTISREGRPIQARTMEDFQKLCQKEIKENNLRQLFEQILEYKNENNRNWSIPGYCQACQKKSSFAISKPVALSNANINFREQLICSHCSLKSRQRFIVSLLREELQHTERKNQNIYVYEQVGSFFKFLAENFDKALVFGSEYLGPEAKYGELVEGIRHENALKLSFGDATFDFLVSCDVFEHIPDIKQGLFEAHRVLSRNGHLLFTIPFDTRQILSAKRAELLANGQLRFFAPPVYHGNPINDQGSLVFYDFGWDIIDICKQAGFHDAYALNYWNANSGYLGAGEQFAFVACK